MRLPSKTIERELFRNGYKRLIAVDEVGMGCLAGPVVVCAVSISPAFYRKFYRRLAWLRDSKLLTSRRRDVFAKELLTNPHIRAKISFCHPRTIDRLNIYQAARLAMRRAIGKLETKSNKAKAIVLVDGKNRIEGLRTNQLPIVKGDRRVFAIACASIVAKVFRDRMMARYAKRFPGYAFDRHKGYSTKLHRARLAALGPSAIHRRSFAPVARIV